MRMEKSLEELINEYDINNMEMTFDKLGLVVFKNSKIKISYNYDFVSPYVGTQRNFSWRISDKDGEIRKRVVLYWEFNRLVSEMHEKVVIKCEQEILGAWKKKIDGKLATKVEEIRRALIDDNGINQYEISNGTQGYTVWVRAGPNGKKYHISFYVNLSHGVNPIAFRSGVEESLGRSMKFDYLGSGDPLIKPHYDKLATDIFSSSQYTQFINSLMGDLKSRSMDRGQNKYLLSHIEKMKEEVKSIMRLGYSDDEVKEIVNELVIEQVMAA